MKMMTMALLALFSHSLFAASDKLYYDSIYSETCAVSVPQMPNDVSRELVKTFIQILAAKGYKPYQPNFHGDDIALVVMIDLKKKMEYCFECEVSLNSEAVRKNLILKNEIVGKVDFQVPSLDQDEAYLSFEKDYKYKSANKKFLALSNFASQDIGTQAYKDHGQAHKEISDDLMASIIVGMKADLPVCLGVY